MDRKQNLDHTGPRRGNGKDAVKEAALDKLRQMEWKRNKTDSWHLARPTGGGGPLELRKVDKNEENYFEGTGVAKNKRSRKPRPEASPPIAPAVPPGFMVSSSRSGSCGPPPLNAWAQKKGSSLFNKGPEADEEDELLQLAKKESMKTLEEDRRRQLERMLMTSGAPPRMMSDLGNLKEELEPEPELQWEDEEHPRRRGGASSPPAEGFRSDQFDRTRINKCGSKNSSRFESDSEDEPPVERAQKTSATRPRKSGTQPAPTNKKRTDTRGREFSNEEEVDYSEDYLKNWPRKSATLPAPTNNKRTDNRGRELSNEEEVDHSEDDLKNWPRKSATLSAPTNNKRIGHRGCELSNEEEVDYSEDDLKNYLPTNRLAPRGDAVGADGDNSVRPKSQSVPIKNRPSDGRISPKSFDVESPIRNSERFYKSESIPVKDRVSEDQFPKTFTGKSSVRNVGYKSESIPVTDRDTDDHFPSSYYVDSSIGNSGRTYSSPERVKEQDVNSRHYKSSTLRGMMIPEKESKVTDLADDLKSTLTFGDTGGLLESFQIGQSKLDPPIFEDMDLFLHNVIRHEQPSSVPNDAQSSIMMQPDDIFQLDDSPKTLATVVADIKPEGQNGPDIGGLLDFANMNGQTSSPQFSGSSNSQSPFGSLGKQSSNYEASPQSSSPANQVPFPINLAGNQDTGNLANHMAQMASAYMRGFIPPVAGIPGMFPVINPMTGQPQFVPPMMMPPIPGQDMNNPFYQQMAMNYYIQLAMMQNQMRQEQGGNGEAAQNAPGGNPQFENRQRVPEQSQMSQNAAQLQHQFQMQAQNQTLPSPPQISPPINQMSQGYQNQQIPQNPQLPQNPQTQYPFNRNQPTQLAPQTAPTSQPMYPMNQEQQTSQILQNASSLLEAYQMNQLMASQIPQNVLPAQQPYQINQEQQTSHIPQNAPNLLQGYQINQEQQSAQNMQNTSIPMETFQMNHQQAQQNLLQTHCLNQNQPIPPQQPSPQSYGINQNQQIPQPAQPPLPQQPTYQAQPQNTERKEEIMMKYHQVLQTLSQLQQEMGGQLPVPMPVPMPVPNSNPSMPQNPLMTQHHYPQMELQIGQMQPGHSPSTAGSPLAGNFELTENREQGAPPPSYAPPATAPASIPVPFSQLPDVTPRGRGMGRRP